MAEKENYGLPAGGENIGDEELLVRYVPLGDDKCIQNNRLKSAALPESHFREQDGWSLFRLLLLASGIGAELEKRAADNGRPYGYALITAGELRAALGEAGRVIADPLADNPAHALAQRTGNYSKKEARIIRDFVLAKFGEVRFD